VTFGVAYDITVSAGSGGTIDPPGPSVRVPTGGSQPFTIAANPNFQISDVLIDSVSIGATNQYTFTNVTNNHSIAATFASSQTPLEAWLASYGLTSASDDADGDGMSNGDEYYAGTIPTGPGSTQSVFKVFRQQATLGADTIQWYSTSSNGPSNGFLIYRSTNLVSGWTLYGTNANRSPDGTNVWTDPAPPAQGGVFYQPRIPIVP
jgi:hypothetical protein